MTDDFSRYLWEPSDSSERRPLTPERVNKAVNNVRQMIKGADQQATRDDARERIVRNVALGLGVIANKVNAPGSYGTADFVDDGYQVLEDGYSDAYQQGAQDGADEFGWDESNIDHASASLARKQGLSGGWDKIAGMIGIIGAKAAYSRVQSMANDQRGYLTGLLQDVMAGDPAKMSGRFNLYGGSTIPFYERGMGAVGTADGRIAIWHTVGDKDVCRFCDERDGQSFAPDELGVYPGDGDFTDAADAGNCAGASNCRCYIEWIYSADTSATGDTSAVAASLEPDIHKMREMFWAGWLLKDFNPEQERDKHGRWAGGGGGSGGHGGGGHLGGGSAIPAHPAHETIKAAVEGVHDPFAKVTTGHKVAMSALLQVHGQSVMDKYQASLAQLKAEGTKYPKAAAVAEHAFGKPGDGKLAPGEKAGPAYMSSETWSGLGTKVVGGLQVGQNTAWLSSHDLAHATLNAHSPALGQHYVDAYNEITKFKTEQSPAKSAVDVAKEIRFSSVMRRMAENGSVKLDVKAPVTEAAVAKPAAPKPAPKAPKPIATKTPQFGMGDHLIHSSGVPATVTGVDIKTGTYEINSGGGHPFSQVHAEYTLDHAATEEAAKPASAVPTHQFPVGAIVANNNSPGMHFTVVGHPHADAYQIEGSDGTSTPFSKLQLENNFQQIGTKEIKPAGPKPELAQHEVGTSLIARSDQGDTAEMKVIGYSAGNFYKVQSATSGNVSLQSAERVHKEFMPFDPNVKLSSTGAQDVRLTEGMRPSIKGASMKQFKDSMATMGALSVNNSRQMMKDKVARDLSHRSGLSYGVVDRMVGSWAATSSDSNRDSIAVQMAIADKTGVKASPFHEREAQKFATQAPGNYERISIESYKSGEPILHLNFTDHPALKTAFENATGRNAPYDARSILKATVQNVVSQVAPGRTVYGFQYNQSWENRMGQARKFVDAQYQATQEHFAQAGTKEITLYRGERYSTSDFNTGKIPGSLQGLAQKAADAGYGFKETHQIRVVANPATSWSVQKATSVKFQSEATFRVMYSATVPVKNIISSPFTGAGCLNEYEYIMVGHPGVANVEMAR